MAIAVTQVKFTKPVLFEFHLHGNQLSQPLRSRSNQ